MVKKQIISLEDKYLTLDEYWRIKKQIIMVNSYEHNRIYNQVNYSFNYSKHPLWIYLVFMLVMLDDAVHNKIYSYYLPGAIVSELLYLTRGALQFIPFFECMNLLQDHSKPFFLQRGHRPIIMEFFVLCMFSIISFELCGKSFSLYLFFYFILKLIPHSIFIFFIKSALENRFSSIKYEYKNNIFFILYICWSVYFYNWRFN